MPAGDGPARISAPRGIQARPGDLAPIALSTMWSQRWPHLDDLEPFFQAGRRMGFDRYELSHILPHHAVAAIDPRTVHIASIHHPCPAIPGGAASPCDPDPDARRNALRQLQGTLQTAARLGTPAVVMHLGEAPDPSGTLRRLGFEITSRQQAGQSAAQATRDALSRFRDGMALAEAEAMARAAEVLAPALAMAASLGVELAVETPAPPLELPTPTSMRQLLMDHAGAGLSAWLDTGHVAVQVALGIAELGDWYEAAAGRWAGVHLHDAVGLRDHLAPGVGEIDFRLACGQLGPSALFTCEVDWYLSEAEVRDGALHVLEAGCATDLP